MKNEDYGWLVGLIAGVICVCVGGALVLYIIRNFNTASQPQLREIHYIPMGLPVTDNVPITAQVDTVDYDHPSGETPNREQLITDKEYIFGWDNDLNWFSCDIYNTGPDPVYYSVNTRQWDQAAIRAGQTITVPFNKKDSIKRIFLRCDPGKTALVYINAIK